MKNINEEFVALLQRSLLPDDAKEEIIMELYTNKDQQFLVTVYKMLKRGDEAIKKMYENLKAELLSKSNQKKTKNKK